jgi:CubicO group peptidase (beta-lactamase class C family)
MLLGEFVKSFRAVEIAAILSLNLGLATSTAQVVAQRGDLDAYRGVYQYRGGATVAIVPKESNLVAIIGQALYPVKHVKGDEFRNGGGQIVRFQRNGHGAVDGLFEEKDFFPLLSHEVPSGLVALTVPASPGANYRSTEPPDLHDGLVVGTAKEVGFDPKILDSLTQSILDEQYPNLHSVLLWKDGKLFFERYFYGYNAATPHELRSATKSFDSALVGIALGKKLIPGLDVPVVDLLPAAVPPYKNFDSRKEKMTLSDLLSMRSGLACDDYDSKSPGNEQNVYDQLEWVRFAMDLPMAATPGTVAHYCSAGPLIAGRIVEHASGQSVLQFAEANLFKPLGFSGYRWPYQTVNTNTNTYGELFLRPRDMVKFGVLFADGGVWHGKQIIPADWISRSTMQVTQIGSKTYGYFWWHQSFRVQVKGEAHEIDTILATGNGGQKIFIVPSYRLVAVFTGGNYNSERDTPPNEIMPSIVLPDILKRVSCPVKE